MRNQVLQSLCRGYLGRLRRMANRHGLDTWLSDIIEANKRGTCSATESEVNALSRLCNDERIERVDIPKILGKSYRECFNDDDFAKIRKFKRLGIYSKVSTLLYVDRIKNKKRNNKRK